MSLTYQELGNPVRICRGLTVGCRDTFKITHLMKDGTGQVVGGSGIQTQGDHGSWSGTMISLKPEELKFIEKEQQKTETQDKRKG